MLHASRCGSRFERGAVTPAFAVGDEVPAAEPRTCGRLREIRSCSTSNGFARTRRRSTAALREPRCRAGGGAADRARRGAARAHPEARGGAGAPQRRLQGDRQGEGAEGRGDGAEADGRGRRAQDSSSREAEAKGRELDKALDDALAVMPNVPLDDVPVGADEHANVDLSPLGRASNTRQAGRTIRRRSTSSSAKRSADGLRGGGEALRLALHGAEDAGWRGWSARSASSCSTCTPRSTATRRCSRRCWCATRRCSARRSCRSSRRISSMRRGDARWPTGRRLDAARQILGSSGIADSRSVQTG